MKGFPDNFINGLKKALRKLVLGGRSLNRKAGRSFGAVSRRFKKSGGFSGLFRRTGARLVRGDKKTIAVCASLLAVVVAVPILIASASGNKSRVVGASSEMRIGEATVQDGLLDLSPAHKTPEPVVTPVPMYLKQGYSGTEIPDIQARLMELAYMDFDEPTDYFGPATETAVMAFQRTCDEEMTGIITQELYDRLFSADAPTYQVANGDEGTDVEELQKRLRALGYIEIATGYYGTDTAAAISEFQKNNNLGVDGMVGEATREMLYSEDAKAKSISYGEKSDVVKKYQQKLYKLGYMVSEPDGNFGSDTKAAVKLFQEQNGLGVDGYIGPDTRDLLMSGDAQPCAISIGDSGRTVEKIQNTLKKLGYIKKVTGYYGTDTETAVKYFQKRNSLTRDGKVGKQTMTTLFSDNPKKAPDGYNPSSGGSSSSSGSSSSGGSSSGSGYVPSGSGLSEFISAAQSRLGCRYVRGGKGPEKFDCSGFVYWCLRQAGVSQGYLTSSGWKASTKYPKVSSLSDLKKGDIIVFKGHVAIALGNGQMIDASSSNGKVVQRSCMGDWSKKYFICAFRIF